MRFPSILSIDEGHDPPLTPSPLRHTARPSSLLLPLLLLAAGLAAGPAPALADEVSPSAQDLRRARELYQEGDDAFRSGRYQDAYRSWQRGYALSGRPLFLVNMAHAERRRGDLASASSLYQRYLLVEPDSKLRADVEAVLAEIDRTLAAQKPAPVPVGEHAVPDLAPATPTATASGATGPSAGQPPAAALLLEASRANPEERSADSPPIHRRWWFWAGAGGALALGVASAILLTRDAADGPARTGTLGTLGTAQ